MSVTASDVWAQWAPMATVIGGFATGFATAIGGGAIWYARRQIDANAETARVQDAFQTYSAYLRMCVEYPELSCSDLAVDTLPSGTLDDLGEQMTVESEKYCWFVSNMLAACEKIHIATAPDVGWNRTIRDQISYHAPALREIRHATDKHYAGDFNEIVEDVIANA